MLTGGLQRRSRSSGYFALAVRMFLCDRPDQTIQVFFEPLQARIAGCDEYADGSSQTVDGPGQTIDGPSQVFDRLGQLSHGPVGDFLGFNQSFEKRSYFGVHLFSCLVAALLHNDVRSFRPGRQVTEVLTGVRARLPNFVVMPGNVERQNSA
jgi:hypothetical protein